MSCTSQVDVLGYANPLTLLGFNKSFKEKVRRSWEDWWMVAGTRQMAVNVCRPPHTKRWQGGCQKLTGKLWTNQNWACTMAQWRWSWAPDSSPSSTSTIASAIKHCCEWDVKTAMTMTGSVLILCCMWHVFCLSTRCSEHCHCFGMAKTRSKVTQCPVFWFCVVLHAKERDAMSFSAILDDNVAQVNRTMWKAAIFSIEFNNENHKSMICGERVHTRGLLCGGGAHGELSFSLEGKDHLWPVVKGNSKSYMGMPRGL